MLSGPLRCEAMSERGPCEKDVQITDKECVTQLPLTTSLFFTRWKRKKKRNTEKEEERRVGWCFSGAGVVKRPGWRKEPISDTRYWLEIVGKESHNRSLIHSTKCVRVVWIPMNLPPEGRQESEQVSEQSRIRMESVAKERWGVTVPSFSFLILIYILFCPYPVSWRNIPLEKILCCYESVFSPSFQPTPPSFRPPIPFSPFFANFHQRVCLFVEMLPFSKSTLNTVLISHPANSGRPRWE